MTHNKKSLYTGITSVILMLLNGLLGLLMTQEIIKSIGSDANGLSAASNQLIAVLMLLEGGFTLAINVSLFKPFNEKEYDLINKILAGAKIVFNKIGVFFLLFGLILAAVYSIIIKSSFDFRVIFIVFTLSILSTTVNLMFATKYRIILQVDNREYILNIISIFMSLIFMGAIIFTTKYYPNIIYVRSLVFTVKRKYHFINFSVEPDFSFKSDSRNVLYQNITSAFYNSFPILFISISAGTLFTSLYAVYNNVFVIIKSAIYAIANAPRMTLGQLVAKNDITKTNNYFDKYEFITINIMLVIILPTIFLIMPFISLYTEGLTDMNYVNYEIALIFIITLVFEIIHIPSGNLINMSGNFRVAKRFQIISTIFLTISIVVLNYYMGMIGVMLSVLFTALLLSILEISFIYKIYFNKRILVFVKKYVLHLMVILISIYLSSYIKLPISNYYDFLIVGFILTLISLVLVILLNIIVNFNIIKSFKRVSNK
jgi:O-antigen/teichoic acid export membrane protein